jgi:hypothetical protein
MNRVGFVLVLALAGCPERALEIPEDGFDRSDQAVPSDFAFDMALQPLNLCPAGANFIYTIDEDTTLSRFSPTTLQFFDVGKIACPSQNGDSPNSMAIDRDGNGWVNYQSGALFRLITSTVTCTATPYLPDPAGQRSLGMSFAEDVPGSTSETLYIADVQQNSPVTSLESINLMTFKRSLKKNILGGDEPELTGDDQANLWGFFPTSLPPMIARIDKQTGKLDRITTLAALEGTPTAWGVAAYQNAFFIFLQRQADPSTTVYRLDGTTHALDAVASNTGRRIVGVGVATCAGNGGDGG